MRKQTLETLLGPAVNLLGYEFVGCTHISQGRHSVLRVYIDGPNGITLEDCEKVSRQISATLDVEDPIAGQYTLEVSSPGIERPLFTLAHFQKFVGRNIKLRLHVPVEGQRNFTGLLTDIVDQQIQLRVEDKIFTLPFASIDKANLIADH